MEFTNELVIENEAASNVTYCGDCKVVVNTKATNADTEGENDDDLEARLPPAERLIIPSHVVDINADDLSIYILGTRGSKVTVIAGLEGMNNLEELILRSCLISSMNGVESLTALSKLELYDNQIEEITSVHNLCNLKVLDLSFNAIREMVDLSSCPLLEELYIAQNKLRKIEGIDSLIHLKILDLGANRIRSIECIENCTSLKSLWLGKNKIESITGIDKLVHLKQLDIQNNRLTSIGDGILRLSELEELYLACNNIENVEGLPLNSSLSTLDLSTNKIKSIKGIDQHRYITELWMTGSLLSTYEQIDVLKHLPDLECLYLEHSPIAKDYEYRQNMTSLCHKLQMLDAVAVVRWK